MSTCPKSPGILLVTLYVLCGVRCTNGLPYIWGPEEITWEQCRSRCQGLGGDMANLHTMEEYNGAIRFLKSQRATEKVWIGLSLPANKKTKEYFRWVDGSQLAWASWGDREPNNMGSKKCVAIRMDENEKYDTKSCGDRHHCLCEGKNDITYGQHLTCAFQKITDTALDTKVPFSVFATRSRLTCAGHCSQSEKCHVFTYNTDGVCSLFTRTNDRVRLSEMEDCDTYIRTVQ